MKDIALYFSPKRKKWPWTWGDLNFIPFLQKYNLIFIPILLD